jgi:hypothetical protein
VEEEDDDDDEGEASVCSFHKILLFNFSRLHYYKRELQTGVFG